MLANDQIYIFHSFFFKIFSKPPRSTGELSSSSASSQSDSNEESFDEEELRKQFDDGYDDKLVGDEEDRRRLDEMTEKEREQILYERLEKREALQKR